MLPAEACAWLLLDSASWASSMTQHPRLASLMTAAGMTKDFLTIGGRGLLLLSTAATTTVCSAASYPHSQDRGSFPNCFLRFLSCMSILLSVRQCLSYQVGLSYQQFKFNTSNIELHTIFLLISTPADLTCSSNQKFTPG